jgi:hypothetical protein
MLKIINRFGKHCSCYLQGEYVMVGRFWKPHIGQEVGRELNLIVLIGGSEERAAVHLEMCMCLKKRGNDILLRES